MAVHLSHIVNPTLPQPAGLDLFRSGGATATGTLQHIKFSSQFTHVILKNDSAKGAIQFALDIFTDWYDQAGILVNAGEQFEAEVKGSALFYKRAPGSADQAFRYVVAGPVTRKKWYPLGWENEDFAQIIQNGNASFSKESNHLKLIAVREDGNNAQIQARSTKGVDITALKTLLVDWEGTSTGAGCTSRIALNTLDGHQHAGFPQIKKNFDKGGHFARETSAFDLSPYAGIVTITAAAYAEGANDRSLTLKIYEIGGTV